MTSRDMLKLTQDTLRILADETDGRAIIDQNDLGKGLKQVVRDTSVYYLLGYNSSKAPQDGKFHEIKVKVKRPGAIVRARRGSRARRRHSGRRPSDHRRVRSRPSRARHSRRPDRSRRPAATPSSRTSC